MISFAPLAATLVKLQMSKTELRNKAELSSSTSAKIFKNENASMEVVDRICQVLRRVDPNIKIQDVIEFVPADTDTAKTNQ